jgi:hypothetical protein
MRFYIISNVSDVSERFSDFIEKRGFNVTLKEINSDIKNIAKIASNNVSSGYVIVLVDDPILASMILNKENKINAALCDSENDIASALKDNANVFIIGDKFEKPEWLYSLMINKENKQEIKKINDSALDLKQKQQNENKQIKEEIKKNEKIYVENQKEIEADSKNKGIFKKIKGSLGIIDNDKD